MCGPFRGFASIWGATDAKWTAGIFLDFSIYFIYLIELLSMLDALNIGLECMCIVKHMI